MVEVDKKNTIMPSSQVQGLLFTSLTSAIKLSSYFTNPKGLNDPKQMKNISYKVNRWCNALLLKKIRQEWGKISVLGKPTHMWAAPYDAQNFTLYFIFQFWK